MANWRKNIVENDDEAATQIMQPANLTPIGLMRNLPYYYIGFLFGYYHLFRETSLKKDLTGRIFVYHSPSLPHHPLGKEAFTYPIVKKMCIRFGLFSKKHYICRIIGKGRKKLRIYY